MAFEKRARNKPPNSGPFVAIITNHLDPLRMGRLEVSITDGIQNSLKNQGETYIAQYLSPFHGATSSDYEGTNPEDYKDSQKSYGFWAIPPDIGNRVLIIFAQGDPNQCYWLGSVQDTYQNFMVPGIASTTTSNMSSEQQQKYGTTNVPVAEYNKKTELLDNPNIDAIPKPVHPFADRLLRQGLLADVYRGITSSSARREVPSQVYGWSTPGPLDVNGKKVKIGYTGNSIAPVSRLGGSSFVMDDGDVGGQNELIRIRTRTGHQILLHNTADLIYIGNAAGTAWMELTSAGKLDVFAQDSVSIHTQGDFNLRADRDFNLEAGRNFNIFANGNYNMNTQGNLNQIAANMQSSFAGDFDLYVGNNIKIDAKNNIGLVASNSVDIVAGTTNSLSAGTQFNIKSGSSNIVAITGGTDVSVSSKQNVTLTAPVQLGLNGAPATAATAAKAPSVTQPPGLGLFQVPAISTSTGWSNKNFYNGGTILSIMQRVPMHEPWDQHESVNPDQFTLGNTDASTGPSVRAENGAVIPAASSANIPYPAQAGPVTDRGTVRGQKFAWSTDQPFLTSIKEISEEFNFDPLDLLGAMYNESAGTYDPAIIVGGGIFAPGFKNPLGSATGLIQFLESTAQELGTTTAALAQMTRVQQMQYVKKYFKRWGWPSSKAPTPTIANVYMTIFLPAFRFNALTDQIASGIPGSPTYKIYQSNHGFDKGADGRPKGYITPGDVAATALLRKISVVNILKSAGVGIVKGQPNYFIVPTSTVPGAGNPVTTSNGTIVTSGSGNPVTTVPLANGPSFTH